MATNYLDRYLSRRSCGNVNFQRVAGAWSHLNFERGPSPRPRAREAFRKACLRCERHTVCL